MRQLILGRFILTQRSYSYFKQSRSLLRTCNETQTGVRLARQVHTQQKQKGEKWRSIVTGFLPVGLCLLAVMQWRAYRKHSVNRTASQLEIDCYCVLPLKTISRWWGFFADINLPEVLRPYLYGFYINCFGVNIKEAANEDLKSYSSLSEFFVRSLKQGVRPIDMQHELVSPCDGTILHISHINTGKVEQVKGVTYSIEKFLGENIWGKNENCSEYHKSLLHKPHLKHRLYQCVIYLAPGDYHRFHSPTEWAPEHRRHFPGELLSVNPVIAKWIPGLFVLNERAVYIGKWKHGFFSYTAVGATNVGSVRVYFDKKLRTNNSRQKQTLDAHLGENINLTRGDLIGEFRMGSTIVLLFEAPEDFEFKVCPGQKVRVGQGIGNVRAVKYVDKVENKDEIVEKIR